MNGKSKKPKKGKGLGAGIVAFGGAYALISVIFHPHSIAGYVIGLGASLLLGWVVRTMAQGLDLTTHNKQDQTPESLQSIEQDTGNPDVDALLQKGREMIQAIRDENKLIPEEGLTRKLDELETLCGKVFQSVYEKPAKASQIRKFMDYYLPTTLKMVKAYRVLGERGLTGDEAREARGRIDEAMSVVLKGCHKLLDNLYRDDVLDISTDIDVLEQMLKRDGLTQSDLQLAAAQAKQAAAIDAAVNRAAAQKPPTQKPAAETADPAQWQPTRKTDVQSQIEQAAMQAQSHIPQAPMMSPGAGAQAVAQKPDAE